MTERGRLLDMMGRLHGGGAWHGPYEAMASAVGRLSDTDLDRPLGTDDNPAGASTIGLTLHGIVQHDAYHAGQISLLKKARG